MKCLSQQECATLCSSQRLNQVGKSLLYLNSAEPHEGQLPLLARDQSHFSRFVTELNTDYRGCLVWITAWGISPSEENPIIVLKLREAFAERRRMIDAPGHLFDAGEGDLATALIRLVLAFAWDAHVIHLDEGITITLSHDGWFEISTNSIATHERIGQYVAVEPKTTS